MVFKYLSIFVLLVLVSLVMLFGFSVTLPVIAVFWSGAVAFWFGGVLSLFLPRMFTHLSKMFVRSEVSKRDSSRSAYDEESGGGSGTLYVGNLDYSATEDDVRQLFSPFGNVISVRMMHDRRTNRFRGYGFVEMSDQDSRAAVDAVSGKNFMGRKLKVNLANDKLR